MANSENFVKIDTASAETINATLAVGQRIRNGSKRVFEIIDLNENKVSMKPLNAEKGQEGKTLTMNRNTFVDLYVLKNYDQIRTSNVKNINREISDSMATGADRYLL